MITCNCLFFKYTLYLLKILLLNNFMFMLTELFEMFCEDAGIDPIDMGYNDIDDMIHDFESGWMDI